MKIINLILCLLLILLLIFGCQAEEIPRPSFDGTEVKVELRNDSELKTCPAEDCKLAISREKARLRQIAERNCQTAVSCISCCSAGLLAYAKIYITPSCAEPALYD